MSKRIPAHGQLSVAFGLSLALLLMVPASAEAASQTTAQTTTPSTTATTTNSSDSPSNTTATYGDWVLHCLTVKGNATDKSGKAAPTGESCEIVQTIKVKGQTKPIAQLAFGHLPGQTDLIMTAALPVNITLPGKVHVSGNAKGGAAEKGGIDLNWSRCVPVACFAETKPTKAVLDVMRSGLDGQLDFMDARGRMLALPLSWRGFTQALGALK